MLQSPAKGRNVGVRRAVGVIVLVLGVCGALPVSADMHDIGTGNMVSFRGGFMRLNQDRGSHIFTDTLGAAGTNDSNSGWFAGAALDMVLSKDAWGGMDKTWVMGEIGLQFNRIASQTVNNVAGTLATSA